MMYLQSAYFGNSDIDKMLQSESIPNDSISNLICCDDKQTESTLLLPKSKKEIKVTRGKNTRTDFVIYSVDEVNFMIYVGGERLHDSRLYLLKDVQYKNLMYELIENDSFIVNLINEIPPDPFPEIE